MQRLPHRTIKPTIIVASALICLVATTKTFANSGSVTIFQPGLVIAFLLVIIAGLTLWLIKIRHQFLDMKQKLEQSISRRTSTLSQANSELTNKISQHEESEALLAATRNYYRSILNSLPAMIIGIDEQRAVTLWNSSAKTTTGIETKAALQQSVFKLIPGLLLYEQQITNAIDNELPTIAEEIGFLLADQKCFVDLSIHPLPEADTGAVILINDVSNRVEVEQLMVQNEKLLSLGEMAAGLAHEINNPLSAVLNNLQNLQRRTSLELPQNQTAATITGIDLNNLQDYFAERQIGQFFLGAREAAERAASIVNNILKFAHSGQAAKGPEPINPLIKDVVELENKARFAAHTSDQFEHKMFVQLNAEQDICECSPPEIQQVVLNLIRNALQACESANINAEINIKTFNQAGAICIEVSDNGPGISAQNLTNVFDPFFTTKGVGEGTGLGLSVSYLIITEHHNGTIEVDSTEGVGTAFTVKLPLMS
ncbi:two-component system sensor histidine kinase NtrB [Halioxenophilus aromaticivorans]|uniref:histidine kinase n=1 Tax=Halioxenophilus aromaticivorans TaxID=1306992 RepID=A0AAV3UA35_9ALTE